MRGANSEISARGELIACSITPRMCRRAPLAWFRATCMISLVIPSILISICRALIPSRLPATLKSMSPRWSSSPRISDRTTNLSSSFTRPIAIPATADFTGTPASISARDAPQTDAIEEEPLDSVISETTRTVYGNSSWDGITASTPRFARRPWPISRRFGEPTIPVSPTQYGGKL